MSFENNNNNNTFGTQGGEQWNTSTTASGQPNSYGVNTLGGNNPASAQYAENAGGAGAGSFIPSTREEDNQLNNDALGRDTAGLGRRNDDAMGRDTAGLGRRNDAMEYGGHTTSGSGAREATSGHTSHVTVSDKLKGGIEQMTGKIKHDPVTQQRGAERKAGRLGENTHEQRDTGY